MEVAVYSVLTGAWWISSATVLLPFIFVLKYNSYLRNKWFSFFFIRIIKPIFEHKLLILRQKAFDVLNENLPKRDSADPLRILEIGIGSGANLEFYPENSLLTALDMNPNFELHFKANQAKYPQIHFDKLITAFAEDMKEVEDSSIDIVISTYVLCSAKSVKDCLKEIKRVLKPGGKFLFLEHCGYPETDRNFSLQKMANPLWVIYFDGCNLTRHLVEDIKGAGFSAVEHKTVYSKGISLFIRPQSYGLATK